MAPAVVCFLLAVFAVLVADRAMNMRPLSATAACAASACVADVRFASGDLLLFHASPAAAFVAKSPWTHVALVLQDVHGREYCCDITPASVHVQMVDLRPLVLSTLLDGCMRVAVRHVRGRAVNARMLFEFVLRHRRAPYTHRYWHALLGRSLWFPCFRTSEDLFCSNFVSRALENAGVFEAGARDALPADFAEDDLPTRAGFRYGPLTLLKMRGR